MVTIKTPEEIEIMAQGGAILARAIQKTAAVVKVGVTLKELDKIAERAIRDEGAEPAFLGYQPHGAIRPYSATICASVNDVIVHGLPTHYALRSGDVLKIDAGVLYKNFYVDSAVTLGIGEINSEAKKLIEATKKALLLGIRQAKIGNKVGDIGAAIGRYIHEKGFSVVEGLTGHGIGRELHEDPSIFNDAQAGSSIAIKEGMVFAIEPMTSAGGPKIYKLPDDSYATEDKSISAQFEHTVAITKKGPRILT
jgi:methionyl aminopeptidase